VGPLDLDVSLVCAFGKLTETDLSFSGRVDPVADTPLFQYGIGNCDSTHRARLTALRARDPDFVDADYALGQYAVEDPISPDPEEGLRRLQSAAAAFPGSPAIATRIGNLHRAWEEWTPALAAYDAAIAVSPNHPEALIGRTREALEHLARSRKRRTPEELGAAVGKALAMFRQLKVPILGIIENMSTFVCPHCGTASSIFREGGARKASARLGVSYLGAIPLDPVLCRASDRGEPILASHPDSPVAEAFRGVSRALVDRIGEEVSSTPVIRMG
jgi:hypothetical protein